MSDFIPPKLLIGILKRLSVEDLGQCLIVSKSWYSLIISPCFISIHSQYHSSPAPNNNNNNRLLLVRSWGNRSREEIYSIRFDNDTFQEYKSLDFPFKSPANMYFRVTYCNGVLCLSDGLFSSTIILWNPSIQTYVTLPKSVTYAEFGHSVGFAFCDATNDFKVVRVFDLGRVGGYVNSVPIRIEVYELSKGYWRCVDPKGFPYLVHRRSPQAYLNGVVHWAGWSNKSIEMDPEHYNTIVSFDMGTEELGIIQMPPSVAKWNIYLAIHVSVLQESLSLILDRSNRLTDNATEIWVMKEYGKTESWSKLFTIARALHGRRIAVAPGFLRNGQVLVTERAQFKEVVSTECPEDHISRGSGLASYDLESKQVKLLGIGGGAKAFYVDNFVETLALLGAEGDTVQDTYNRGLQMSSSRNSSKWDGPKYARRYCLCGKRADIRETEHWGNKSTLHYMCRDDVCVFMERCVPVVSNENDEIVKQLSVLQKRVRALENINEKKFMQQIFAANISQDVILILSVISLVLAVLVALFK